MNQNKQVRWLYDELPKLVAGGVLDETAAERVRAHYGPVAERRSGSLALLIFGVLGVGLVGLGIILILANNWDGLSRPVRAGISFGLLLIAQALAVFAVMRRPDSRAMNEAAGVFLGFCVGAVIALIGQTYNLPGDFGRFLATWMLLIFPLMYLMNAGTVTVGYLVGITAWSAYQQEQDQLALWFWPMAALAAPFIVNVVRKDPYSARTSFILSAVGLCALVAVGVVLDRSMPGLWIPMYASLLSVMYMGGAFLFHDAENLRQKPIYAIGAVGLTILSFVFTFSDIWDSIGWNYYRTGDGYSEYGAFADGILTAVLMIAAVLLLVTAVRRRRAEYIPLGAMPILATVAFAIASSTGEEQWAQIIFNVYILIVSIFTIANGIRRERLEIVNSGMMMFAVLAGIRFFDSDLPFVVRGVGFIAIGIGFLVANTVLIARKKAKA